MNNERVKLLLNNYQTPMYVFDTSILRQRVNYLKNCLPDNVSLCYAVKANTFIMKELSDIIDRFEVCSPGELSICRELDMPMEKIIFSGVYKTPSVIKELTEAGIPIGIYSVESMLQYKLIVEASKRANLKVNIMPRLTSGNQFGMTEDEVKEVIRESKANNLLNVCGIQFFSGTQKTSMKKQRRELEYVDGFLQTLKEELSYTPDELEFGPGFPVSYFQGEEYDEDEYMKEFTKLLSEMNFQSKITLELGRSIVASCGTYLTRVVDMKNNKGQNYAIVDGGINQLVYFGQSMAMKHPICSVYPERADIGNATDENIVNWNICGSLCTVNDIIVKQLPIQDLKIDDVLVFENTGAYCMTEGISLFLSRDLPTVVLVDKNRELRAIRKLAPTYPLNKPSYE